MKAPFADADIHAAHRYSAEYQQPAALDMAVTAIRKWNRSLGKWGGKRP